MHPVYPERPDRTDPSSDAPRAGDVAGAATLEVRGLTKHYSGALAVDRLSFSVGRGEILGLVGPNGAGKTTTLRTIAGVLPIEQGQVRVAGFDLSSQERAAKARLAWVPDDPEPFDALTVEEHLEFVAALYGVGDWRDRADGLLGRFELTEKRGALGGELSRGMRQKLAFCCAWLPRPELVLLDEPLSGLDPRGIRAAKLAIRELAREGAAIVLSSHLLDLVQELGTRLLVLDRGRAVFDGTLERALAEAAGSQRLEEVFFHITGGDGIGAAGADPDPSP